MYLFKVAIEKLEKGVKYVPSVSIVDFKHVNVIWEANLNKLIYFFSAEIIRKPMVFC